MGEKDRKDLFAKIRKESDSRSQRLLNRPKIRGIIWEKTRGTCWYCGKAMNPFTEFSIDHRIPRSLGGTDDYENLVPCCRKCDSRKNTLRQSIAETIIQEKG